MAAKALLSLLRGFAIAQITHCTHAGHTLLQKVVQRYEKPAKQHTSYTIKILPTPQKSPKYANI